VVVQIKPCNINAIKSLVYTIIWVYKAEKELAQSSNEKEKKEYALNLEKKLHNKKVDN